ncbi:putative MULTISPECIES: hypothetical protein [Rosellinia necatrix]|uniref:Uncharacterized protein n=1 Tax=Rosellinia necatrix TaxID=77044 RepID=A0A1S7UIL3_ROSNE|nr:putative MULTISPECIES: hypothetical protein [Rosellinia necatrix]
MMLKNTILLLAAATTAVLAGPVAKTPKELPVTVIEGSSKDLTALELPQANKAILLYRSRLGENGTRALIASDVAAADAYWRDALARSTGGFVGGTMRARGYAPRAVFNATTVGLWFYFGGSGWPNDFLQSSPEHYLSLSGPGVRDPKAAIESIENWGPGPITYFKGVPEPKPDFIPALEDFPADAQSSLALHLADGTVFAHSVTAFRDLPDGCGVEIFEGIWIPDSAPADVLEGLRAHITVEFSNWLKLAYKKAIAAL